MKPLGASMGVSEISREMPPIGERLNALRCLVAVTAHGSAKRAAEAIHLSQPAVTRTVLDLEKHCGVPLFERCSRGMLPTVLGARLAQRAEVLFAHLAQGASEAVAATPPAQRRDAAPRRFAEVATPASLAALIAVAATASEATAAELLGLSQPAVHRALRLLEDRAGAVLFRKSPRGTRLTDSGEALLRRVKLAFAEARSMESEIAAWRGEIRGRVVIGLLPLSVTCFVPAAVDAVRRRHPDVEITVADGTYESLMQLLRSGDVDVIVGALRHAPDEVRQEALFDEPLAVIARGGHPCFARPALTLAHLLEWEWVLPLPETPASAALERVFAAEGLKPPRDALRANNAAFTRSMVAATDRLTLASLGQARDDERAGRLRIVPVPLPGTLRPVGLARRAVGAPSPDLAVVLDALREAAAGRMHVPSGGKSQNE